MKDYKKRITEIETELKRIAAVQRRPVGLDAVEAALENQLRHLKAKVEAHK